MLPPPCCPDGRITNRCAAAEYARRVLESYPLSGSWRGWRIQGRHLIGPGGIRFTPETARIAHAELTKSTVLRGEARRSEDDTGRQLHFWPALAVRDDSQSNRLSRLGSVWRAAG
jgi:hypothetical protein